MRNPLFQNMRPWWVAFIVTWIVVAVLLISVLHRDPTPSARIALLAGAAVAGVVWAALRPRQP